MAAPAQVPQSGGSRLYNAWGWRGFNSREGGGGIEPYGWNPPPKKIKGQLTGPPKTNLRTFQFSMEGAGG